MTDFGKRLGAGDMLKSVYDPDHDGDVDALAAHKTSHQDGGTDEIDVTDLSGELTDDQPPKNHALADNKHTAATLAELNAKVSDATLDDSSASRTPSGHKGSHEEEGTDPINVTGLTGTTPRAMLGDATAGRVIRGIVLILKNGTAANTIKAQTVSRWNGDNIAEQDNIGKDATTGHFKLNATGIYLTILNTGLTGNALYSICNLFSNSTGGEGLSGVTKQNDGIQVQCQGLADGTPTDLTTLLDAGDLYINILYITDA